MYFPFSALYYFRVPQKQQQLCWERLELTRVVIPCSGAFLILPHSVPASEHCGGNTLEAVIVTDKSEIDLTKWQHESKQRDNAILQFSC